MPVPPGILSQFERALREGRFAQAITHAERAVALSPADAIAMDMLRAALYGAGRYAEALTQARAVVELIPEHAGSWASLGFVLARLGKHVDAAGAFERAGSLDGATPGHAIERITALIHAGLLAEAEIAARGAITRFGPLPDLVFRLSTSLCEQGRTTEAAAELSAALFSDPANVQLALTQCSIGVYSDSISPDALSAMHRNFGRILSQSLTELTRPPTGSRVEPRTADGASGAIAPAARVNGRPGRGAGGRVRVGIISSDFRAHSVAWFSRGVLCGLDRGRFETRVYSTSARADTITARLQEATTAAGGVWIQSAGLSATDLRQRLLTDRIDLLLDLNGLTEGGCWEVLARRAAPVQCSFLGYPHTTGLASVDYRLVDERTDPREPRVDAWHVERLIRVDGGFLCYRPPDAAELPAAARRADPGADRDAEGAIVFGSFNRLAKVSPRCKRVWANVLLRVPGSRLVIKSGTLVSAGAGQRVINDFVSLGVEASRIEIRAGAASVFDHLSQYTDLDIALDTFPYAGTTTTCEALLMGVPVVSLAPPPSRGGTHAHRVGLSLLSQVGLADLAPDDDIAFVEVAAALASDTTRRRELRTTLRSRLLESPLCDERLYGVRLSDALWTAWNDSTQRTPTPSLPA